MKMKRLLLISAFATMSLYLLAQEKPNAIEQYGVNRLEKFLYENGSSRLKLTISPTNDTIFSEKLYQNGLIEYRKWGYDSIHYFDNRGNLRVRYLGIQPNGGEFGEHTILSDSTINYHINGRLSSLLDKIGKTFVSFKRFTENGALLSEKTQIKSPLVFHSTERDGNGKRAFAARVDTFFVNKDTMIRQIDSFFHANGHLKMVGIVESHLRNYTLPVVTKRQDYFDNNGQFMESTTAPDSFYHTPFKDNLTCLYGFKNEYGDTLIAPKYEQVINFDNGIYAVYEGLYCQLMRIDGSIIPTPKMNDVGFMKKINNIQPLEKQDFTDISFIERAQRNAVYPKPYFFIKTEGKTGVIDRRGSVIIPPQYLPHSYLKNTRDKDISALNYMNYVGNADFIAFSESKMDNQTHIWEHLKNGFLNKQGKDIFGEKYKTVEYADYEDYFVVSEKLYDWSDFKPKFLGLADSKGQLILPCRFEEIRNVLLTPLFITTTKALDKNGVETIRKGMYNVVKKEWILDTTQLALSVFQRVDTSYINHIGEIIEAENPRYFIFQEPKTRKYGLLDGDATVLLPPQYDTLGVADAESHLFWYKKKKEYSILKLNETGVKRAHYDYLLPFNFPIISHGNTDIFIDFDYKKDFYFIAKRNNKWGIIHAEDEAVVVDFDYEYAAVSSNLFYVKHQPEIYLFKNNQAYRFDVASFPMANSFKRVERHQTTMPDLTCFLVENPEKYVFLDTMGKVIIPPQYRVLETSTNSYDLTNFARVESADKKQKIILLDNARIVDFPFDYRFVAMHADGKLVIVQNEKQQKKSVGQISTTITQKGKYGVVSTEGKQLLACENFSIALSDPENKAFFAKRDTPKVGIIDVTTRICSDSLNTFDRDWLMYNAEGELINSTPFRCPIVFKNGVGIGIQGQQFGIFRSDGTRLNPNIGKKEYANIWRDYQTGLYVLYQNRGLTSTIEMMDKNAKIRVEAGRYDGISAFFGKYALVSNNQKIGLMDTLGVEIVAPKDLAEYRENIIDSLKAANLGHEKADYTNRLPMFPITFSTWGEVGFTHPDSLRLSPMLRNAVWNLIIDNCSTTIIRQMGKQLIERPHLQTPFEGYNYALRECYENRLEIIKLKADEKFIAFVSNGGTADYFSKIPTVFYNFYRKNNRWERVNPLNFFKYDTKSQAGFYETIVQKIRALKDADIDCTNASTLIEQARNQFVLTGEGITIYFQPSEKRFGTTLLNKDTIHFTWAEILPFLTPF
jgi:hypothetical protein